MDDDPLVMLGWRRLWAMGTGTKSATSRRAHPLRQHLLLDGFQAEVRTLPAANLGEGGAYGIADPG